MGKKGKNSDKSLKEDIEMKQLKKPKEKRRNSEKRKEKSRDAARCRRSKESEIFADLANTLPIPNAVTAQMDKASVMRLAIAYLKIRQILGTDALKTEREENGLDNLLIKSLDGFLLVLSSEGDVVYTSDSVTHHLGLSQMDVLGQPLFDYCHPCDHEELRDTLLVPKGELSAGNKSKSFFLRLKCTLTNKGRTVNLKSASYKVIHFSGRVISPKPVSEDEPEDHGLILIGEPIPHPSCSESILDDRMFMTKHSMDLKFNYADDKILEYFGYCPADLEGKSLLEFHHILDGENVGKTFKILMSKGQAQTTCYRFLAKNGGYVWVETQATVIYGPKDGKPQSVVCVHYVLSGIEQPEEILSLSQLCGKSQQPSNDKENLTPRVKRVLETVEVKTRPAPAPLRTDKRQAKMPFNSVNDSRSTTANIFSPRMEGTDTGFLGFDEANRCFTMLKDEPEDLTYLAPGAGDSCIPLSVPNLLPIQALMDMKDLPNIEQDLECLPLTAFEFPRFGLDSQDSFPFTDSMDGQCSSSTKSSGAGFSDNGRTVSPDKDRFSRFSPISEDGRNDMDPSFGALMKTVRNKGDLMDLIRDDVEVKRKHPVAPVQYTPIYSMLMDDHLLSSRGPIIKDIPFFSNANVNQSAIRQEAGKGKRAMDTEMVFGLSGNKRGTCEEAKDGAGMLSGDTSPITCNISDDDDFEHRAPMISMCDEIPFISPLWDLPELDEPDPFGAFEKEIPILEMTSKPKVEIRSAGNLFSILSNIRKPTAIYDQIGETHSYEKLRPSRPQGWRSADPVGPCPKKMRVEADPPLKTQYMESTLGRLLLSHPSRPVNTHVLPSPREPVGYEFHRQPRLTGGGPSGVSSCTAPTNQRRESVLLNLLVSGVDQKEGYSCAPKVRDKDFEKRETFDPHSSGKDQGFAAHDPMKTIVKIPQRTHRPYF